MVIDFQYCLYFVIMALSISYLYKGIKQIVKKDISFYGQELFTDESVEKWAIIDGILKSVMALICGMYGLLCLCGNDTFWYVPVVIAVCLILYIVLYKKTLIKKDTPHSQE